MKKLFTLISSITLIISLQAQNSPLFHPNVIEGPDAPDAQLTLQGNGIKIDLGNSPISNNYNESFAIKDISINNGDNLYRFQGYLIYQAINDTINPLDNFFDPSKMRLVAQSDIADTTSTLINNYLDTFTNNCTSAAMVNGNNLGIQHSYSINTDAFSGNTFQQGETYCYYTFAYAYNGNKLGNDCNQLWTCLLGFKKSSGSGLSANCITFNVTSTNDYNSSIDVNPTIYPNPANDNLKITFKKSTQDVNLQIIDITGKVLVEKEYLQTKTIPLNLEGFTFGVYFIKITTNQGYKTLKFIKN